MLLAVVFGAVVGAMLGLFGGGGSTLAIPLLAYGIGMSPREAIATSLVAVGLAALAGAVRHWRCGTLDLGMAVAFGIVGAAGSALGAQLARALLPAIQMILFALVMIVAAILMLRHKDYPPAQGARKASGATIVLAALGPGLLTGVAGIGAGFVVVPALVGITGMPIHRAIGTSLLVIAFNAGGGIASYASYVTMDTAVLVPFSSTAIVAVVVATTLGSRIEEKSLRRAFSVMLILVGTLTVIREAVDLLGG
jgi:hypothetical protein